MEEATYVEGFHDVESVKKMTYNTLGQTGLRLSSLSLGGCCFGNLYGEVTIQEGVAMIHCAIRSGMNYIDTSPWYGNGKSEEVLGKALVGIPRKAYYLATKVGRYEPNVTKMFDFSAEKVFASVEKSLRLLGVDYVDLIQVHDIEFAEDPDQIINETLPALQKIVDQGKARFIGITSYSLELMKKTVDKSPVKLHTVLSYARNTLVDKSLLEYLPFFQDAGVGVINASVTCLGLLSSNGPQAWHPAGEAIQAASDKAREMAKDRGIEIANLALQSSCRTPGIVTSLLGCVTKDMLLSSIDVVFRLPTEQEKNLAEEIEKECFASLPRRNWEGNETETHFRELKAARESCKKV